MKRNFKNFASDRGYKIIGGILGVSSLVGSALLGGFLEDLIPIKEGIEDKITSFMPNIPIWWDNGNFFDITKETIISSYVGWTGLIVILALIALLIWKWKKVWRKKFIHLVKEPKFSCICKECGHAIRREEQGEICRTCDWYKQN